MSLVTIVIPTHNRPNYLWRCINYLSERGVEWPVMVIDSSDEDYFDVNEVNINNIASDRFIHLDCRGMSVNEKYEHALNSIKTKYLVLCGDDDFLVLPRVNECLKALESNPDCSHAHGRIIVFWESRCFNKPIQRIREYGQSPNEGGLYSRLAHHLRGYQNNFYAVHRTEDFKQAFRLTVKVNASTELLERILAFEAIISGGRKMVDGVLMFRQKGITGVDERGNKTFSDSAIRVDERNGFDENLFAYLFYFIERLRGIKQLSNFQKSEIICLAMFDYRKWIGTVLRRHARLGLKKMYYYPYYKLKNFYLTKRAERIISRGDLEAYGCVANAIRSYIAKAGN